MAFTKIHESFVYAKNAGADLSANLNYLGKIDTDGDIILATAGSAGFPIVESAIENKPVTIQFGGIGKAIAGAAFDAGVDLSVGAGGKLIAATGGVAVVGHSLEAAAGDLSVVSYIISHAPSP